MESTAYQNGGSLQLILFGVFLILAILFLLTEQNTLRTIRTENRQMTPGQVWLQLIPLFGQVWQFVVVSRIAGSIRNEIASWDNDSILGTEAAAIAQGNNRPTMGIGITYCILNCSTILLSEITRGSAPTIVGLISLASIVCWVWYWVHLARYKRGLRQKNLATL